MSLLQVELYDALKSAGAPEAEARQAAIEAAQMNSLLVVIAERMNGLESKLTLFMWGMGIGFAAVLAALWQILLRLPR